MGRRELRRSTERAHTARTSVLLSAVAGAALLLGACGSETSVDTGNARTPVERGERIAAESGCQACHGREWQGGIAPTFIGLAGSTVTLQDGSTVVADTAYLTRAIADPSAEKAGTSTMVMPPNQLSAEQVADVVAFIESLAQG